MSVDCLSIVKTSSAVTRSRSAQTHGLPDQVRLSDLEPRFVCQACGRRGADVRPDFLWNKPHVPAMGYRKCLGPLASTSQSRCRTVASFERSSTLGRYVDALPRSMHEREEWKTVMEVLLSAVEGREPASLLRIATALPCRKAARREGHGTDEGGAVIQILLFPLMGRVRARYV